MEAIGQVMDLDHLIAVGQHLLLRHRFELELVLRRAETVRVQRVRRGTNTLVTWTWTGSSF